MRQVNCFDVVSEVVDEATNRFSPIWKPVSENINILRQYCDGIDNIADEFDGVSYEVSVDEITMDISLSLTCKEITVLSGDHILYKLLERVCSCEFSSPDPDTICITFTFPPIWERM